jgi:hypothetical protein
VVPSSGSRRCPAPRARSWPPGNMVPITPR